MFNLSTKKLIVLVIILVTPLTIFEEKLFDYFWPNHPVEKVVVNGKTFDLEFANNQKEREKGLSGRDSLPDDHGLFFVFDQPDYYGFWMKEMKFPIDIVWFDKNKKVVGITRNLTPESYPKIFYPPQKIKYALEVNAKIIP